MSLTAAELLKPRYEVIADFPHSAHKVGDILTGFKVTEEFFNAYMEKFPHIFKKLNWWEHRKVEEMPKKVMSLFDDEGDTFDIQEWDMEKLVGWVDKKNRRCCSLLTFKPEYGYIPVD